ncbi:PD-(D/E)XK nuclease family protein [Plantactinospora solaniradicis]|uniref:PD-(D/E)XK nuclease family protein n=1 Tax=Plantactinospora solaniradicis TaxID=1723736 RepID=A0ABW1KKL0_9ACTN
MDTGEKRRYTRSVSQLKGYSRCGEAFRLERMVRPRLPARPASWLIGGTAFQTAVDAWEIAGRSYGEEKIKDDFSEHYWAGIAELKERQPDLDQWIKPPRTKTVDTDIANRLNRGLTSWIPNYLQYAEREDWEIWTDPFGDLAIEVEFEWTFGNGVTIKGSIDRMLWWPRSEKVSIEDIKTGNRETDYRQPGLYGFVANRLFVEDLPNPISHARYWYAKDGVCSDWEPIDRYTEEYLAGEYGALDRGIEHRVFVANPGDHCDLCGVRPYCRLKGFKTEGEVA